MNAITNELAKVAKAIASGGAAAVGTIVLALDLQPADHQGIQFLTQSQWGIIVLAVLASYGITWRVPNRTGLPGEEAVSSDTTDPNVATESAPVVAPGTGSHVAEAVATTPQTPEAPPVAVG